MFKRFERLESFETVGEESARTEFGLVVDGLLHVAKVDILADVNEERGEIRVGERAESRVC